MHGNTAWKTQFLKVNAAIFFQDYFETQKLLDKLHVLRNMNSILIFSYDFFLSQIIILFIWFSYPIFGKNLMFILDKHFSTSKS